MLCTAVKLIVFKVIMYVELKTFLRTGYNIIHVAVSIIIIMTELHIWHVPIFIKVCFRMVLSLLLHSELQNQHYLSQGPLHHHSKGPPGSRLLVSVNGCIELSLVQFSTGKICKYLEKSMQNTVF